MTGWELVTGKEPVISEVVTNPGYTPSSSARDEVQKAIDSFRGWIRIGFYAASLSLVMSFAMVYRPNGVLCWALLVSGLVAAFAFLAAGAVGAHSDSSGAATVHHHSGFWVSMAMALFVLPLVLWCLRLPELTTSRRAIQ
jgi:hypothetical protein